MKLNEYNVELHDFNTFFRSIENKIINKLYDFSLLNDKSLKNVDSKKIFHKILIEETLNLILKSKKSVFFVINSEIIDSHCQLCSFFSSNKIKKEIKISLNYLKKNKFNNFLFLPNNHNGNQFFDDFIRIQLLKSCVKLSVDSNDTSSLVKKFISELN